MLSLAYFTLAFIGLTNSQLLPLTTVPPDKSRCEPITGVIVCLNVNWKNATFPNYRQHPNQIAANTEIISYIPLIQSYCSNAIVHFLCSVYTPFCMGSFTVPPCRELCEYVQDGCEPVLQKNGYPWPESLRCSNFPEEGQEVCIQVGPLRNESIPDIPGIPITRPTPTSGTSEPLTSITTSPVVTNGATAMPTLLPSSCQQLNSLSNHPLTNRSYSFGGLINCAVTCNGVFFSETERNLVAPIFILLCAIVCIGFTLFTVGTFLIDRGRFHYPERPVIFLALCYLILSVAFIVGVTVKLAGSSFACSDNPGYEKQFIFQNLPDSFPTYHSASCVILFIFIYYFQMAAAIWWVVLTLTWFLASSLKWGEEAIERPWILYHIITWCLPAIQVILILILKFVDGDQLSGLCYPGNYNTVSLGVFVFFPLALYLLVGVVFLAIGFISLVHIRIQISRDPVKSSRLQRLIIRIFIYSLMYVVPNLIFLILCLYEIINRNNWESAYNSEANCRSESGNCSTQPNFVAFLLRYLMLFVTGIFSTFWVISWKTFLAWKKFFLSVFCCRREQPNVYVQPNAKRPSNV